MSITHIQKRNGAQVPFEKIKITSAIEKAFQATHTPYTPEVLSKLTDTVIKQIPQNTTPTVEYVQDMVEKVLADEEYFTVSRAYILYREKRTQERQHIKEQQIKKNELLITKGDREEPFNEDILHSYLSSVIDPSYHTYIPKIIAEVKKGIYHKIPASEIRTLLLFSLRARIEQEPNLSPVAAHVLFDGLYEKNIGASSKDPSFQKQYKEGFKKTIERGVAIGRYDKRLLSFDLETLSSHLIPENDSLFHYLGAQTLYDRYFMKDFDQNIFELPQYFWMRIAMGLALEEDKKETWATTFYTTMSSLKYLPSTPTLFHAGTTHPQMSSCYLTTVEDDLTHIFKSIGDNAQLAKWSGGIGNDWSNIRATGSLIKSTNVGSQGVIPFLKIVDSTTAAINRSGKRRGATCVYLETWHYDIEDFIELRKNTGDDRRRTHDTNTAHWIPDLFMQRVAKNEEWTLFSPDETPDLHDLYGQAFKERYEYYEKQTEEGTIALYKKIPAIKLWRKMITQLFETGHPWITFKDPCNIRSPQDHVGVVHSSNLCTEITLNTSKDETAVCNLGSLNIPRFITNKEIEWDELKETIRIAIRMLDNVINLNFYPIPEAKNSNIKHRPIGLGMMGWQDALYLLQLQFDSNEAIDLSDKLMEYIAYHAIEASSDLAQEKGVYESYKGSKWDRGIFPLDTLKLLEKERQEPIEVNMESTLSWDDLKEKIAIQGMRNSNCLAIAPTATIANISGSLPSIEPIYKNLYTKSNFSGEFTVINRYLVDDLKKENLWNETMLEKIKHYEGSIQHIEEIPKHIQERYKEVFEIHTSWIIEHAARRSKWIDQSQSLNIFTQSQSGPEIARIYQIAWKKGIKTTYYLRTLGASSIEKSTIDINKHTPRPQKVIVSENICEACE